MKLRVAVAAMGLAAASCSAGDGAVSVELDEFSVSVSPARTEAGHVQFEVRNAGEIPHTFFVLRTDLAEDELPVSKGAVDVEADGIEVVGAIEDQLEATDDVTAALATELAPGAYVLICEIPGHYQSGMYASLAAS